MLYNIVLVMVFYRKAAHLEKCVGLDRCRAEVAPLDLECLG